MYLDSVRPLHKWIYLPGTRRHLYLFMWIWTWPTAFFANKEQGA